MKFWGSGQWRSGFWRSAFWAGLGDEPVLVLGDPRVIEPWEMLGPRERAKRLEEEEEAVLAWLVAEGLA